MASSSGFTVATLEALSDNFMYLIGDAATGQAAVVDPVEPKNAWRLRQLLA